jgi:gp16 family phage-associated protein
MTKSLSKDKKILTPEEVRAEFIRHGISVAEWAKEYGFCPAAVSSVLSGKLKCLRGRSHEIAVRLGMKDGVIGSSFGMKDHEAN